MSYAALQAGFREIILLRETLAVLEWDSAVSMPEMAAIRRGQQVAIIGAVIYEKLEALSEQLGDADDCPDDDWHQANLNEMRHQTRQTLCVPKTLQVRLAEARQVCEMYWRDARTQSDFSLVAGALDNVVALNREALTAQAETLDCSVMDAAIAGFEPGLSAKRAGALLEEHVAFVKEFLPTALESTAQRRAKYSGDWQLDVTEQEKLCRALCYQLGLPNNASRIDVSSHPFSSGYPSDARITIRFEPDRALSALCAAIHETGHALYEVQLPQKWSDQPVGQSRGMVLHESQSLSMEMQAGRSREFLGWLATHLAKQSTNAPDLAGLLAESWHVAPSPIRVDADEVTYPLHVLLRFNLEQELLSGNLAVRDLPEAFRAAQKDLLDLDIRDDREGCLQDIHWYLGAFGYFPCYALGAMAAAQLFQAARSDAPEIIEELAQGDFSTLRDWMGRKVHAHGSSLSGDAILKAATGAPLGATALQQHLRSRYG